MQVLTAFPFWNLCESFILVICLKTHGPGGQRRTAGLCVAYLECLPHPGASQCGVGAFVTGGQEKELGLWVSLLGSKATL